MSLRPLRTVDDVISVVVRLTIGMDALDYDEILLLATFSLHGTIPLTTMYYDVKR